MSESTLTGFGTTIRRFYEMRGFDRSNRLVVERHDLLPTAPFECEHAEGTDALVA